MLALLWSGAALWQTWQDTARQQRLDQSVREQAQQIQLFEGICIRKKGKGVRASFTVLKESYGDKVEKIFPLHSPNVEKVTVSVKGKVRRAKLYYLKNQ